MQAAVEAFGRATAAKDYQGLCDRLLAPDLVQEVEQAGLPCEVALRQGLGDVQAPTLTIGRDQGRRRQGHRGGQQRRAGPAALPGHVAAGARRRLLADRVIALSTSAHYGGQHESAGAAGRRLGAGARAPLRRRAQHDHGARARGREPDPGHAVRAGRRAGRATGGAARGAAPASVVVRAGEGVHVEGAALDAHLLDRFERPGRVRRAVRDPLPRGRGARGAAAPVRRGGAAARARGARAGRAGRRGGRARPGRLRVLLRLGPARLRSARARPRAPC